MSEWETTIIDGVILFVDNSHMEGTFANCICGGILVDNCIHMLNIRTLVSRDSSSPASYN